MSNILPLAIFVGASMHTCQKMSRHIIVMKENEAIHKSVLQSLILVPISDV
jgi:hypothetical protein